MSATSHIPHHDYIAAQRALRLATLALCTALCAPVFAADDNKQSEIDALYQRERAACDNAPPSVDRAACLREAAAARDEARRGALNGGQANYDQNALARCDALPAEERELCRRRTRDEGVTKGSVTEGGIYREYKEITLPSNPSENGGKHDSR